MASSLPADSLPLRPRRRMPGSAPIPIRPRTGWNGLSTPRRRLKGQRDSTATAAPFLRVVSASPHLPHNPELVADRVQRTKPLAYLATAGSLVSLFLVSAFVMLAFWVAVPVVALGWNPVLITSGSMALAFGSGDIVLFDPSDGEGLGAGTVISFDDPAGAGRVSHRIYSVLPDGRYITKGDANAFADSTPLEPGRVEGVGRLLVPFVGLPLAWAEQGAWLNLGVAALFVASLLWLLRSAPAEESASQPFRRR